MPTNLHHGLLRFFLREKRKRNALSVSHQKSDVFNQRRSLFQEDFSQMGHVPINTGTCVRVTGLDRPHEIAIMRVQRRLQDRSADRCRLGGASRAWAIANRSMKSTASRLQRPPISRATTTNLRSSECFRSLSVLAAMHMMHRPPLQRLGEAILSLLEHSGASNIFLGRRDGRHPEHSTRGGGEQGDPLMPMVFAFGQHPALPVTQARLLVNERVEKYDDMCAVCRPDRCGAVFTILQQELPSRAEIQLHHGKTQVWNRSVGSFGH